MAQKKSGLGSLVAPFAKIWRLRGKLLGCWLVSPVHTYGRRGDLLGLTKYSTINHWHGLSDQEVPSRRDLCDYVFTAVDAIRPGTAARRLRARDVA